MGNAAILIKGGCLIPIAKNHEIWYTSSIVEKQKKGTYKMNKIQKALAEIEKIVDSGRLPSAMTSSDLMTAHECVKVLSAGKNATCVQSCVRDFFLRLGFEVKEDGIGWTINA